MKRYKNFLIGGLAGIGISLVLFLLVNLSLLGIGKNSKTKKVTSFKVEKVQKKKKKKIARQKPKKKKNTLKPDLKNITRGLSFGIPAFEIDFDSGSDFLNNGNYVDGSKVEQKPKIVYRPELSFPEKALDENISGYVILGVFIDENGDLKKVDLLESSPQGIFDKAALLNIKKWRFKPAVHKGVQVATWQEQKIVFSAGDS